MIGDYSKEFEHNFNGNRFVDGLGSMQTHSLWFPEFSVLPEWHLFMYIISVVMIMISLYIKTC